MVWKYDDPGKGKRAGNDPRGKDRQDCVRKDFVRWGLKGRGKKSIETLIDEITAHVNKTQRGLSELGKQTGRMVKKETKK